MIDTNTTKEASLSQGYYSSGTGPEEILLLGSCRTIAFLNYLVRWNNTIGQNRFTIRRIDPCEYMERGIAETIEKYKTDPTMLSIIKNCQIFIHEHLATYGMFNTDYYAEENIYQFGMKPKLGESNEELDIAIPNWHDHLILKNDWVDYGAMTPPDWIEKGEAEIEKFCGVCALSSFPEFGDHFRDTWRRTRYFYRPNHTAGTFTTAIFKLMNEKFLHLETDSNFWNGVEGEDLFKDPHTSVTDEDRQGYGLTW